MDSKNNRYDQVAATQWRPWPNHCVELPNAARLRRQIRELEMVLTRIQARQGGVKAV